MSVSSECDTSNVDHSCFFLTFYTDHGVRLRSGDAHEVIPLLPLLSLPQRQFLERGRSQNAGRWGAIEIGRERENMWCNIPLPSCSAATQDEEGMDNDVKYRFPTRTLPASPSTLLRYRYSDIALSVRYQLARLALIILWETRSPSCDRSE